MKLKLLSALFFSLCFILSGCGDQIYLERSDIILLLGIDLNDKNELIFYADTPVFSSEVKKKDHQMKVIAKSLPEAGYRFDALSPGTVVHGKIQTIVIGKKLLQNRAILPYLDAILRNPKDDLNSRVVMIDGAVEDLFHSNMSDKGRLGVVIRNMIDTSFNSGIISNSNIQQFTAQQLDTRFTPMIPAIKVVNQQPRIIGMALLSHEGRYVMTLNLTEGPLALSIQKFFTERIPLSLHLSSNKIHAEKDLKRLTIQIKNINRKVDTRFVNGHFEFDVRLTLSADLVGRMFFIDAEKHSAQLIKSIEEQLNKEYQQLIKKLQQKKIDPIGFGTYAKAMQYDHWEKIKGGWFDQFANAKIKVRTHLNLVNTGVSH